MNERHIIHPQKVAALLLSWEYQVRVLILNSADYGEAQARDRVFLFGVKKGLRLPKPRKTHGPYPLKAIRTVKDAIRDLEDIEPGLGGFITLPNGKETFNHTKSALKSEMAVTDESKPTCTVRCGNHFQHYKNKHRILTNRELARVQGFPDEFRFLGKPTAIQRQIGNAVPCNMAFAVAKSIKNNCFPLM